MLAQSRISVEARWSGLVYRNVREQVFYRIGENADFFQYRTRGGAFVPFAVRAPEAVLGFLPVRGAPSRAALAAAHSFLRRYANAKVLLVTDSGDTRTIDDRTAVVSATRLLFP